MEYEPLLKEYIYIYDTPSWDLEEMQGLMALADAIVLWGSDEAVGQVRKLAPVNTELIEWGHKLSFCYIGELSVSGNSGPPFSLHKPAFVQFLPGRVPEHSRREGAPGIRQEAGKDDETAGAGIPPSR